MLNAPCVKTLYLPLHPAAEVAGTAPPSTVSARTRPVKPRTRGRTPLILPLPSTRLRIVIEQRKTVSVVFADLVDSTALAEQLDPELLATILRRYFAALRAAIEAHGGTVEKYIGDA